MLAIRADQMFTIGTVRGVPQPVVVSNRLRNVPEEAIYNWDPGAFFGVYHPDSFWFGEDETVSQAPQAERPGPRAGGVLSP